MERYSLWQRMCLDYLLYAYVFRNYLIIPKEHRTVKGVHFAIIILQTNAAD